MESDQFNKAESKDEAAVGQQVYESLFPRIARIENLINEGYLLFEDGSTLAVDGRYLGMHHTGMLPVSRINAALDAARTIRTVLDQHLIPMTGLYPLLRAGIENSAVAIWLLAPTDRKERVLRSLQLAWAEEQNRKKFQASYNEKGPNGEARIQSLSDSSDLGLKFKEVQDTSATSWGSVVGQVDDLAAIDPLCKLVGKSRPLWHLFSGMSHAEAWALTQTLDRSNAVIQPTGDSAWVQMTSSTRVIAVGLLHCVELCELAMRIFGQRARKWTARLEDTLDTHVPKKRGQRSL